LKQAWNQRIMIANISAASTPAVSLSITIRLIDNGYVFESQLRCGMEGLGRYRPLNPSTSH
jgi:hypothetical protein